MRVLLHASHLVVDHKGVEVARHEQLIASGGGFRPEPDHYLELLLREPGAAGFQRAGAGPPGRQVHTGG